jgi:DNA-binding LytR/AlgR family response regulator
VVFVTAYDEYAVDAFEQEALDYVLKPVKAERLQRTLERVRRAIAMPAAGAENVGQAPEDAHLLAALQRLLPAAAAPAPGSERLRWVRASKGELMQQIAVDEVLYFHADDKYTCVRTAQAEHLIRTPIAELAAQLDPALFCQVHRSTIVNLRHLEGTRRDEASRLFVRIKGLPAGRVQELPVSRAYVHLFKAM